MRMGIFRPALVAASGLLCAVALPSAASATSIDLTVQGGGAALSSLGGIGGNITYLNASNKSETKSVSIGQIALTGKLSSTSGNTLTTLSTFCIDVYDWLNKGVFTQTDKSAITSPNKLGSAPNTVTSFTATQLDSVLKLLVYTTTGSTPRMNNAITSAATQMAIWEILNETTGSWDVGTGTFNVSGGNATQMTAAIGDANSWLGVVKNGSISTSGYDLTVWDPNVGNQRQIQLISGSNNGSPPAVPEPATWGTIVLGFGALGSALRNRKRANALAA